MCATVWPLVLLLSLLVLAVSRTLAVVTASPSPITQVGQSLNLSCSITTTAGDTIHQVRWLKDKSTLLAYQPGSPVHVSHQDPNILLSSAQHEASHITIKTVRPEDEGCFLCIFDVYPRGQQQGKACVKVTGKVIHQSNTTTIAGTLTTLPCSYTLPARVHQVLWRRINQSGHSTTLGSYSKLSLHRTDRVTLNKNLSHSQLSIQEATLEDESCYVCEFHTYPDGTKSATTCLTVDVLPTPKVNYETLPSGAVEANCSAQSKPSVHIEWDFGGDNRTLGLPVYSSRNHSDGTTTQTSTVLLKAASLSDVKCIVHHPRLEKPIFPRVCVCADNSALIVLVAVCVVLVVLLLCLCFCLCKCFVCNKGKPNQF
ncbi:hypothetical protein NQD34_001071 [Periophthalmus magnuspinnatus]|nr:hypothetical protein NQD34_001071 [Periophthalmus magnuspinnatus]